MNKSRRNSTARKIYVLLLAFLTVFSSLGGSLGPLGVRTVYAESNVITTAEEFADMEPGGDYELGADITITAPYAEEFSGTFDGKGHTVTLNGSANGVFRQIGNGGCISNLAAAGTVSGTEYLGGIAGRNSGTIVSCRNSADIAGTGRYIGGIAGNSSGSITDCCNTGEISSTRTISGVNMGGIAGCLDGGRLTSCYNTGTISAASGTTNYGAVAGWVYNGTVENCYFLETESIAGTNTSGGSDMALHKSEEEMKSPEFAALLGDGFMVKAGDYPALAWEIPTASAVFSITPADAVLTITSGEETVYTGAGGAVALPAGSYTYTVTCDGYISADGTIRITEEQAEAGDTVDITAVNLAEDADQWTTVNFTTDPENAQVLVKDGDRVVPPQSGKQYRLLKTGHVYTYTVTAEGCEDENGTVDLAKGSVQVTLKQVKSIALSQDSSHKTEYYVGEELDTDGLKLTVEYEDGTTDDITKGFEVTGFDSAEETGLQRLTVSYKGQETTYDIGISVRPGPLAGIAGKTEVNCTAGTYGFDEEAENGWLKSGNQEKSSSRAVMTVTAKKAGILTFRYKISSESNYDYLSIKLDDKELSGQKAAGWSGEVDWTEYSLTMDSGSVLTISYIKDSSGNKGDDTVWLKDFQFEDAYYISISADPESASISLKDSSGADIPENAGRYIVTSGTYTYTASAFGYEDAAGEIAVNSGDVNKTIVLTSLPVKKVTFSVSLPDGVSGEPAVEVKHGSETMLPSGDGTYSLPAGTYSYTVTHTNCEKVTGEFTVAETDVEILENLTRKWVISDYFHGLSVAAVNGDPYGFVPDQTDETVLVSGNQGVNSSTARFTLTADRAGKLSFSYKVGSEKNYDKFTIAVNGVNKVTESGEVDWKSLSLNLAAGDTVTVSYAKDSSTAANGDTVWMKDFTFVPLYRLTFSGAPEGTSFIVKQDETEFTAESDGSWFLETGRYTYTASAFGCSTETGEIVIETEDVEKTVSLTEKSRHVVSFSISRMDGGDAASAEVTVKYGDMVINPEADGTYSLPAGDYTYAVTCEGCEPASGEFTVEESRTVSLVLEKKLIFEDFFTALAGRVEAANQTGTYAYKPVKDGADRYLQSSNTSTYSTGTITFSFRKPAELSFEYMVSEEGSTSTDSSYGMIVKRNGTQIDCFEEVSEAWKQYTVSADAGDIITVTYSCYKNSYAMTQGDENWLRLKNFTAEPLTRITFTEVPESAEINVKKDGKTIQPADGKYLLHAGDYSYDAAAFGYEPVSGRTFTVNGSEDTQEITAAMTPTERAEVTFVIDESVQDPVLIVKNSAGRIMEPSGDSDRVYSLPKNEEYSCQVSADGYLSVVKYFRTDAAKTISISLISAGSAWDGQTKSEPQQENGVYLISSGGELAWFADKASENPSVSGRLTANINLGGFPWTGFGQYDYQDEASGFAGTLDGNGYTVSGLSGSSGLVECLAPGGVIKNLTVDGNIAGSSHIGGIANTTKGTIENCLFRGSVSNTTATSTGGIAGRALTGNVISGCVSTASVANTCSYYNSALNTGGIAGYTYGVIENCFFTGTVEARTDRPTNYAIGGIAGRSAGEIRNCYTIGMVTGPESGTGAAAGTNSGNLTNVYYLEGTASGAIASNSAASAIDVTAKTSGEMKTGLFAYTLGEAFNQDSIEDSINNGYPVLKWQGGSRPSVPQFEQDALADRNAIVLKEAGRADELETQKRAVRDDLARDGMFAREWETIGTLSEEEKEAKLAAGYDEYLAYQLELMEKTLGEIYEIMGIDLSDDGTLQPDAEGVYVFRGALTLVLPAAGEKGSIISWSSTDETVVNPETGEVTLPAGGKAEVTLTASVSRGDYKTSRNFQIVVYSDSSRDEELLSEIKAKAEKTSTFIQPLQMYNHTNMREVMEQWLSRNGYRTEAIDGSGITVEFADAGTKAMPGDDKTYIGDDGAVTYFTGSDYGYGTKYALYNDVKFRLKLNDAETEVSMRAHIGWDAEYVQELLDEAMDKVTWESIRGSNSNSSQTVISDGWERTSVEGDVTGDLTLPYNLTGSGTTYASIKWTATDMDALYVSDNGDGTYTATLVRPAKGEDASSFTLKGIATFEFWDDYTIEQTTTMNGRIEPAESFKLFDITVPANTEDQSAEIEEALEKYPLLLRDFVDKTQQADPDSITDDLQMPIPSTLEDNGIMTDRYYQKVVMTSSNTDLLEFNGYHAYVYRPLPGEAAADVEYTVRILDRRNNALLGEKTFTLTIEPLSQQEIDDAAAWMNRICTEEVFWNGIRGENTSKDNVTSAMEPFEEILDSDGEIEYVRGAINLTFGGAEVDDLPGYDPMSSQPWRQLRSSKPSVVACETLQFEQPEYNTEVTLDSVLTHSSLGKYWTKFGSDSRYRDFEQFYKRPVEVTITLAGRTGKDDPDPKPDTISVTVSVDGKGYKGFRSISSYKADGLNPDTATAWDAVRMTLTGSGYTFSSVGDYISSVTDPNGITLTDKDTANSGWLYTVNGVLPDVYLGSYYLKDGDKVILYYTSDYTEDPLAGGMVPGDEQSAVTDIAATVRDGAASATVPLSDMTALVDSAVKDKAETVAVNVTGADDADKISVEIPKVSIADLTARTDSSLQVNAVLGSVRLDKAALQTAVKAASGSDLTIVFEKQPLSEEEKVSLGEDAEKTRIYILSGGKEITDFGEGKITVSLPVTAALSGKNLAAVCTDAGGRLTKVAGRLVVIGGKQYFQFDMTAPGTFSLAEEAAIDMAVSAQDGETEEERTSRIIKGVQNTKITITKTSKGKGWIKLNWKKSKGYKVDYYEVFRKTGKNGKFGKTAFYKTKKNGITASYKNTKSLKKGTRYYYKVRGVRLINGQKVYTKWSKTIYRIAK